ncbi:MAG: DEAD/DEAH box helicase [Thaumarchaeota archaeon]|nr:DEAD/DEAH box helicase [Nitrososphaerota archaeon]MCL5317602.1 DEAD/DEAH box helicase [Nitrososphaerota archaeon]
MEGGEEALPVLVADFIEHPNVKPGSLQRRDYQVDLASLCSSQNTLLVVPTGLGKTAIALLVVAELLKNYPEKKCLMLAPTRPLCHQHYRFLQKHLTVDEDKIQVITGTDLLDLRREKWSGQIICATPQITVRDIARGLVTLGDLSLIIFDEAHRAVGDYAYCSIGKNFSKISQGGRMMGMTASLPDDEKRVKEILLNLDLAKVEFRDEASPDVKPYVQKTDVEVTEVSLPPVIQNIRNALRGAVSVRVRRLRDAGLVTLPSYGNVGMKKLLDIRAEVERRGDQQARSDLTAAIRLNHAITLLETQSVRSFTKFFDRLAERYQGVGFRKLMEDQQIRAAYESARGALLLGVEHPKIDELKKILKSLGASEKAIVFASYRDSVEDIYESLCADGLRARYLIGKSGRGQSQDQQVRTIEDMRGGLFDILVATQVGEEGLDISECNLVIFYDNVPSAVRFIQRRGRTGRESPGRVIALVAKGTKDESYYWSGQRRMQSSRKIAANLEKSKRDTEGPMDKYVDRVKISPLIYVDTRESLLMVDELKKQGSRVDVKALPMGDFVLSTDVVVERKTAEDFVKSVIDGRLFSQLVAMREAYPRPLLVLEGDRRKAVGIGSAAFLGALASVITDFQVSIYTTNDESETAQMLFHIARREQMDKKKEVRIRSGRKPVSISDQQKYIVAGLPGVSTVLADRFLRELKTVAHIFNATEEELTQVEGVGEKLAKRITEISRKEYTPEPTATSTTTDAADSSDAADEEPRPQ